MKFYVDENLMPDMAAPLTRIYRHRFRVAGQEGLGGIVDIPLFGDLAMRDFDAIITKDKQQLEDSDERTALRKSGLNWIGVPDLAARGTAQLATQLAVVAAGLHWVLDDWRTVPTIYRLVAPRTVRHWIPSIEAV